MDGHWKLNYIHTFTPVPAALKAQTDLLYSNNLCQSWYSNIIAIKAGVLECYIDTKIKSTTESHVFQVARS